MAESHTPARLLPLLLPLLVTFISCQRPLPPLEDGEIVISVDPERGNDDNCLSAAQIFNLTAEERANVTNEQRVCETINKALGYVSCDATCDNQEPFENVVLRLEDGTHRLTGCVGIVESRNITLRAANWRQAVVKCERFPNNETFDNLVVCNSENITFEGIRFENCGPQSPNVFLNRSSDILFDGCKFT